MIDLIRQYRMRDVVFGMIGVFFAVAAMGTLAFISFAARAAETTQWGRWNVAPFASSREEACKKASLAINGLNMPETVKEHFKEAVGTTCKGGTEVWLTPHQQLNQMWSGGAKPHVTNNVTVGELPVLVSPDGRHYRKGAVAEAAKALSWTFVYEGQTYTLYMPFVCFNWSWSSTPVPEKKCVELAFNAKLLGFVRWGVGTASGPLPPDECNAQKQDNGPWMSWYGQCDVCVPAVEYIRRILGNFALIPHKYLYPVTATRQTLRFSTAIWSSVVYICLEDETGKRTCGVYMRPEDWKGRYHVDISDSLWLWDDKNCPN